MVQAMPTSNLYEGLKSMKIISKLPNRKCFAPEKMNEWFVFKDIDCTLKIYSRIPDPFSEEVCILFSIQNKKSDATLYPYNLILKVFPVDEVNTNEKKESLCRKKCKTQFPYILGQTSMSFHFPHHTNPNFWISYFTYQD